MKKIISVCAVFFLALAAVFAEFTPANFSLNYKTDSTEKPLAVASSAGLSVSQAYSLSYGGVSGELRYALFADAGLKQGDAQKAVQDFAKKLIPGIAGISPVEVKLGLSRANVPDIYKGDFGYSAYIDNVSSAFAGNWQSMIADFFYKHGQGLVVRIFLFNDKSFMGLQPDNSFVNDNAFAHYFSSFEFN